MTKISGVIISLNEAHTIARSVRSAFRIADEVIVIDAHSEDQTAEIATKEGAKVIIKEWQGYGAAKNHGHQEAVNDWILSLDADEEMSEELVKSIEAAKLDSKAMYQFKIVMDYMGRKLRFTEYAPHWKPRLFHKEFYYWDERVVHEKLQAHQDKKSVYLKGDLMHYSFTSREHHASKVDHYALLSAKELIRKSKNPSALKRIFGPAYRFFRSYILKLGILEGADGYYISKLAGNLVRKRHQYYHQLKK